MMPIHALRLRKAISVASWAPIAAPRWDILITDDNGHTNVCIVEFEWLDIGGSVIPLTGGSPFASSWFSGSFLPGQAYDGVTNSTGSRWASADGVGHLPVNLGYAFAGDVTPYAYRIYPHHTTALGGGDGPRDFQPRYSLDGGASWIPHGPAQTDISTWVQFVPITFPIVV